MRRIICITGNGKGKTTCAVGSYVRALGAGLKVGFYQFLKSRNDNGENVFFNQTEQKIILLGYEKRKNFDYDNNDIAAAISGFERIKTDLLYNNFDLLILDEVTYPINWGWISVEAVTNLINLNPKTHFILTGRDMPKQLIDIADTVSEINEIKHAYTSGAKALKGIEF